MFAPNFEAPNNPATGAAPTTPSRECFGVFDDNPHHSSSLGNDASTSDAMRSFMESTGTDDVTSSFFLMKLHTEREHRQKEQQKRFEQQMRSSATSMPSQSYVDFGFRHEGIPHSEVSDCSTTSSRDADEDADDDEATPVTPQTQSSSRHVPLSPFLTFQASTTTPSGIPMPMPTYVIRDLPKSELQGQQQHQASRSNRTQGHFTSRSRKHRHSRRTMTTMDDSDLPQQQQQKLRSPDRRRFSQ